MSYPSPNINRFWADLIVDELIRNGVRRFFLAPGSRSSPLVAALAQHPLAESTIHFDERGAAFAALGYGRAARHAAAWITTSGTAAANGLPAVIEAAQSHIPFIALTADRPPELRDAGANQAIDQIHLFGSYPNWFFDLPCPTSKIDPAFVLTTVDQAVFRAVGSPAGPVHLNCPFREPLAPIQDDGDSTQPPARRSQSDGPFTTYYTGAGVPDDVAISEFAGQAGSSRRPLMIAGELKSLDEARAVSSLASTLGWPVLADVTSQMRLGDGPAHVIASPHFVSAAWTRDLKPDLILRLGGPISSKDMQRLADGPEARIIAVQDHPERRDQGHVFSTVVRASVASFCEAAKVAVKPMGDEWLETWIAAGRRISMAVNDRLADIVDVSEPGVAATVAQNLPEDHALFVASSMPIRDVDMFGSSSGALRRVAANRGASGIDGTVASAFGYHTGADCPVTLLIGDLALLHDLNSLALVHDSPMTLVVVNNSGGGIFNFLPIADYADIFEPWFTAPHGWSFEGVAKMFGLRHEKPLDANAFRTSYDASVKSGGPTLIEVETERYANRDLHAELRSLALDAGRTTGT